MFFAVVQNRINEKKVGDLYGSTWYYGKSCKNGAEI